MKHIFVLYTGGTIGMIPTAHGLAPDTALAQTALALFSGSLKFDWHICDPLIDSSAVSPTHWAQWLALLQHKLPDYDGILVLHGTDTMAYTANIFSLFLNNLQKPIILTGAQKPFSHAQSDAPANLHTSLAALSREDIGEVLIAFGGQLWPAVGSQKCSTERDSGFDNPHFGAWQPKHRAPDGIFESRPFSASVRLANIFFTPAQSLSDIATAYANINPDGVILHTYGHGNAPENAEFLAWIAQLTAQNKPVLNISQAAHGRAANVYAQGNALRQAGAINAGRCNAETATALMMLACANRWNTTHIRAELQRQKLLD